MYDLILVDAEFEIKHYKDQGFIANTSLYMKITF